MCGFGGVVNHQRELDKAHISKIASLVSFRGPDSCGIRVLDNTLASHETGRTSVFFNRLAVIDLDSRSDQPFEDDHHLLMFNGEIYNYTDLKKSLENHGVVFKTTSDTEVLFHGLRVWGTDILPRLNGMFAFFWLNKRDGTYLAARDRLGIKPLYYHYHNGSFYFSSELHSILRMMDTVPAVSPLAVDMYLWMQFVPTPYSIWEGINKLPPASAISGGIHAAGQPVITTYWDAYLFTSSPGEESQPEDLEEILRDTLQRQLHADVPIGLFLSSGVDSSLLAAIVNKYFAKNQEVNFFTVSFGEQTATDESADAKSFVRAFNNPNLRNRVLEIDPRFMQEQIGHLYEYYDEPFGDYASLLNWAISKKARDYVTVAISGDGADELFWGYDRYTTWQQQNKYNIFGGMSQGLGKLADALPTTTLKGKLQKTFLDPVDRHFDLFLMPEFRKYLNKKITRQPLWAKEHLSFVANRKDLPGLLDIKTYLADAMLYKVDRASMATSLEVRVPYLDNKVLEYALKLDLSHKSNNQFRNKAILKNLLMQLAPQYDATRPKKGFSFPLRKWLKNEWKEQVTACITPAALNDAGLPHEPFMNIVNGFYQTGSRAEVEVWYIFNLLLWKDHMNKFRRESL